MEVSEIKSTKFETNGKEYCFKILESNYLSISEKSPKDNQKRNQITVPKKDLPHFMDTIKKMKRQLLGNSVIQETYSVEEIRRKHPNAYKPWSAEDDDELEFQFHIGKTEKELSKLLGRKPGAIRSRLRKLGLRKG